MCTVTKYVPASTSVPLPKLLMYVPASTSVPQPKLPMYCYKVCICINFRPPTQVTNVCTCNVTMYVPKKKYVKIYKNKQMLRWQFKAGTYKCHLKLKISMSLKTGTYKCHLKLKISMSLKTGTHKCHLKLKILTSLKSETYKCHLNWKYQCHLKLEHINVT